MQNMSCPKCKGEMEPGVVPDMGYGKVWVSRWQRGAAEKGLLGGLKVRGRLSYEISVYRCKACGYLESYAVIPES
jgi:Domain of unknown function (DUF6487)